MCKGERSDKLILIVEGKRERRRKERRGRQSTKRGKKGRERERRRRKGGGEEREGEREGEGEGEGEEERDGEERRGRRSYLVRSFQVHLPVRRKQSWGKLHVHVSAVRLRGHLLSALLHHPLGPRCRQMGTPHKSTHNNYIMTPHIHL